MISLNQLDQLTSINQTLSNAYPSASGGQSTTGSGASGDGTGGGTSGYAVTSPATAAAMQMLASSHMTKQAAVSTSVSLPAF